MFRLVFRKEFYICRKFKAMNHKEKLIYLVDQKSPKDIASKLGVTTATILNKRKGHTPINTSEGLLIDILYQNHKDAELIMLEARRKFNELTK